MQKTLIRGLAAAALATATVGLATLGGPASAAGPGHPDILARDSHGRATEVRVDGQAYMVCNATRQDDCINPRAAGLSFGNRPLDYWPGKPASEMKG